MISTVPRANLVILFIYCMYMATQFRQCDKGGHISAFSRKRGGGVLLDSQLLLELQAEAKRALTQLQLVH